MTKCLTVLNGSEIVALIEVQSDATFHQCWRKAHVALLDLKYLYEGAALEVKGLTQAPSGDWTAETQPEGTERNRRTQELAAVKPIFDAVVLVTF